MDSFLLSRADRTLHATGARQRFTDLDSANRALERGDAELIVGALPFDPEHPAALTAPGQAVVTPGPWQAPAPLPPLPPVRIVAQTPSPAEHVDRVTKLLDVLRRGELGKVVAARSVTLAADGFLAPESLVARMIVRHPTASGFAVDLTSAGDGYAGHTLVGASPEVLLRRRGRVVTCHPLAGTAPRRADPDADRAEGAELLRSTKNRDEHAFVTAWIRDVLRPLCTELDVPAAPVLIGTRDVWHLATPISGTLRDPATSALALAAALHPTPAVCGTPADRALATILEAEEDRRFYGGAVGWCDRGGDGDWVVAIRCAEISADGRRAVASAGGGIVVGSEPVAELDETTAKLRTLLGALGVAESAWQSR